VVTKALRINAFRSGKSSLLSALLGELKVVTGSIHVRGRVAYAAQQVL